MEKKSFVSFDGKKICYRVWAAENPKGLMQIAHGMAEGLSRYEKFAEYMVSKGFTVFGDDHRGHGDTDPDRKAYVPGDMFNDTLKDMSLLSDIMKKENPDLKIVLFGHSYGSFLTQSYMQKYGDKADAFIVGGSAYMKNFATKAANIIAKISCAFGRKEKAGKLLDKASFDAYNKKYKDGTTFISSIKEECDKYYACEECGFTVSNGFYKSFFSALPKLYSKKNYIKTDVKKPVLLISGKEDPVGGYGKSVDKLYEFYLNKVGIESVEKVLYEGVRHEYLNDVSAAAAKEEIADFALTAVSEQ